MAHVTLSEFYPYVLPEVKGCPEPLADIHILAASIEFCAKTHYWLYTHAAIDLVADTKTYTISRPSIYVEIETIIDPVYINGQKVWQKTKEWLDANISDWQSTSGSTPLYYTIPSPGVIRPVPYPDANITGGIEEITLALKPKPNATLLEDFLFDEFYEVIANGAKARLMEMPEKEWSNPNLAMYYQGKFDHAVVMARTKAKSGYNTDHRYRRSKAHFF